MDEKYRYPLYPEFSVLWETAQKPTVRTEHGLWQEF